MGLSLKKHKYSVSSDDLLEIFRFIFCVNVLFSPNAVQLCCLIRRDLCTVMRRYMFSVSLFFSYFPSLFLHNEARRFKLILCNEV